MCYTETQVLGAIALAMMSGSDWEAMLRRKVKSKLDLPSETESGQTVQDEAQSGS